MVRKVISFVLICTMAAIGIGAQAADAKKSPEAAKPQDAKSKLVTEGEFAKWLVNVLGLAHALPVAPSDKECFAILLQNSISPKAGWNSTNLVTMGTLARVVVQSMHKQSEVKNPADDNSWIQYLKSIGVEFGTVGQAMAQLNPLDPAYTGEAAVTSTDPLRKQARTRPVDDQQYGADLQPVRLFQIEQAFVPPTPKPPKAVTPS